MNTRKDYLKWDKEQLVSALMSWMEAHAKAESLAAEAVAKEGARIRGWLLALADVSDGERKVALVFASDQLARGFKESTSDWLAKHDASVAERAVEPWREAVADMVENCCEHTGSRHFAEYRVLLSSPAAVSAKEDAKCECHNVEAANCPRKP